MSYLPKGMRGVACGLAACVLFGGAAQAAVGLNGAYFTGISVNSVADAADAVAGVTPTATFTGTTICYPSCGSIIDDGNTLGSFLGSNATDLSTASVTNLSSHVMTLTGFLNIATAGVYSFGLGSDDGSVLRIGDEQLLNDGNHSFGTVFRDFTLDAGLHAISILQFENGGQTGLTVTMNGQGLGGALLQTDAAVPEPATWLMMILGFGVVGTAMRRKRAVQAREATA